MHMNDETLALVRTLLSSIKEKSPFYAAKYADFDPAEVASQADFERLPFTTKEDLRAAYPLGLAAVPASEIVRIHSSSGTTGVPVIIPYTAKDVDDWSLMFARCYEMSGITRDDRIHITPGYGLWTAGIGFQLGAERMGAMTIPMGPGNTDKQLQMMMDLGSTVLGATSSYALLLAETIAERGIRDKIKLRKGVIGSERWGEKMRRRIASELGVDLHDIYGLTEIYGPGIGINCEASEAMHIWDDFLYCEIINPETGEVLPNGESGELVITTLVKEGAPLVRYRTHDLTRFVVGACPCGASYPRIERLIGRSDDMVKVKGVNIFPAHIEEALAATTHASSEYQVMIDHLNGKDILTVFFETAAVGDERLRAEKELHGIVRAKLSLSVVAKAVDLGDLPRSEKKTKRIFDNRY
ncbi:MAG: phenylacetate--CoA ligase [Coriobacteriia bacterium]|nr:phenylacetate--CoA ligase [Coriobacteriia bacterium]MCL2750511.1 phenylacetate--CoA ligase [Coriobacteriia bacterium]